MHFLIGNQLRNTLVDELKFLDPQFNIQQIYVRSTAVSRTIMSARSQLFGLYPPGSGPVLSNKQIDKAVPPLQIHNLKNIQEELGSSALNHRTSPVPVHVTEGITDLILGGTRSSCPYAQAKIEQVWHSKEFLDGLDKFIDMGVQNTIRKVFKKQRFSLKSSEARSLADNIVATDFEFPLQNPMNITDQELENVKLYLNYAFFQGDFGSEDVVKLSQTAFFMDIIQRFTVTMNLDKEIAKLEEACTLTQDSQNCKEAQQKERNRLKFTFYSAHDTNMAGISKFLGLHLRGESPPFASTFFFKLVSKTDKLTGQPDDYLVYIEFNEGTAFTFDSFSQFEAFVSDRTYQGDLKTACSRGIEKESDENSWQIILLVIVGVLVVLGIGLGVYCYCKRRQSDHNQQYPLHEESDRQPQKQESTGNLELATPYGMAQL